MAFLRIKQRACEAVRQSGFKPLEFGGSQAPVSLRHASEAGELGAIAVERHDERAVGGGAWIGLAPKRETSQAELAHDAIGAFLLAIWGEHGAGIEAARMRKGCGRALAKGDVVSPARKRQRLPETDDAR